MELLVAAFIPVTILLVGISLLLIGQITGFFQFQQYYRRHKSTQHILSDFVDQIARADVLLYERAAELENLTRQLQLSNEELTRLNALRSKFISMAAHDMRNPLFAIRGFAELAGEKSTEPTIREMAGHIRSSADHLNGLLGDLTDLAQIEAGKLRVEMARRDLNEMLLELAPRYALLARQRGQTFHLDLPPTPTACMADRGRLSRVVTNLLDNALKFTPRGGNRMAVYRFRKEDLENHLNRGALWAVTYGDLMSYLMILFLLLFSFAIAGKTEKAGAFDDSIAQIQQAFGAKLDQARLERMAERKKQEQMPAELQRVVAAQRLADQVKIVSTEEKINLVLQAPVLFDLGKADLRSEAKPILDSLLGPLNGIKNDIVVAGYTDALPITGGRFKSNWELSMARAYGVIDYLVQKGVDPSRLSGSGYGQYHPVASNATPEGRAKNRRIEIGLIKR